MKAYDKLLVVRSRGKDVWSIILVEGTIMQGLFAQMTEDRCKMTGHGKGRKE